MSKAAAQEYAALGLRVNSIYPGMIDTPQRDTMLPEEREMIRTSIPMKRIGNPDEVAHCSLFLCSDEASYVTGAEIIVDGGLSPGCGAMTTATRNIMERRMKADVVVAGYGAAGLPDGRHGAKGGERGGV